VAISRIARGGHLAHRQAGFEVGAGLAGEVVTLAVVHHGRWALIVELDADQAGAEGVAVGVGDLGLADAQGHGLLLGAW
jgi:hypothetical protein